MPHLVSGINSLVLSRQLHSVLFVSDLPVPAPTTSSHAVDSPLLPSITPSVFYSRSPGSFMNLSHHRLSSGLHGLCGSFRFFVFVFSLIPLLFLFIGSVRQTKAVVSCAIIVYNNNNNNNNTNICNARSVSKHTESEAQIIYNYFRIWAGLSLSISVCDVTSKMSADEKLLLLSAADGSDDFIGST